MAGRPSAGHDETAPPLDSWLAELALEVVGSAGSPGDAALSRDVVLDGERRFDLRVTVAWVAGVGCALWAYYGLEEMELPKRILHRMLRANFDYPYVKFALTDDDRPMLLTELPSSAVDCEELGRGLVRLIVVADRLLEETAAAVADQGVLPVWADRVGRNPQLLAAYRSEIEAAMPSWEPPARRVRRPSLMTRLFGSSR